jgi:hypothetical protein
MTKNVSADSNSIESEVIRLLGERTNDRLCVEALALIQRLRFSIAELERHLVEYQRVIHGHAAPPSANRVAILRRHDAVGDYKLIPVPAGQSEDFDEDSATRRWLWPYLGYEYHLKAFADAPSAIETNEGRS